MMSQRPWNTLQPGPRKVTLLTRYGQDHFLVRPVFPARRLYAAAESRQVRIQGSEKGRNRRPTAERTAQIPEGSILFPRRDPEDGRLHHDILLGGIYDAIRARMHTALRYGVRGTDGETQELTVLCSSVAEICCLFADYGQMPEDERQKLSAAIADSAGALARDTNPKKVDARERLAYSADFRDRLGRINPGASRARVVAAWGRLGMRLQEIRSITAALGYYEWTLVNERDRTLAVFSELERALRLIVGENGLLRENPEKIERSRKGMAARLRMALSELDTIFLEPFIFSRDILREEIAEAANLLERGGSLKKTVMLLNRSWRSISFRLLQHELEQIRLEYSCAVAAGRAPEKQRTFDRRITDFAIRAKAVLDDEGFRARPKARIIDELMCAAKLVTANQHKQAKDALRRASNLFSRP